MVKARANYHDRKFHDRLEIGVGWQREGGVYGLHPLSEDRIREKFPDAVILPMMMLGYDDTADIDRFQRPHWPQMVRMLTGLTDEQLAQLGPVQIYDPHARAVIWE